MLLFLGIHNVIRVKKMSTDQENSKSSDLRALLDGLHLGIM